MKKNFGHTLPPVIRVFLSSTFADMENERSYFNEVIVPRLNRICASRGVSFFSVDLRWGITEDEQMNGKVLPICLGEIDRCRPYFIGILGNRYGSRMETVPMQISDSIPWLKGKEGKSITELEMLYAVLDSESNSKAKYSSFYFRSNELTEKLYGPSLCDPFVDDLKKRIRSSDEIINSTYNSIEEFGELVMKDILSWCDKEFPVPERVSEVRREWYNGELLRNYVKFEESHSFLDSYCVESTRSLLLYGDGERGKTTLLTAWEPQKGEKVLINCGSDNSFRYWPTVAINIIKEIVGLNYPSVKITNELSSATVKGYVHGMTDGKNGDSSNRENDFYFGDAFVLEDFRIAFLDWINNVKADEPIYIVINDLNLLKDDQTRMLSWIPSKNNGSVRFICSTNNEEMVEMAEITGWNCKEMPLFTKERAEDYVRTYLNIYGKSLSVSQNENLLRSTITSYPGQLRTVADFLINHGRFENLDNLLLNVGKMEESSELYPFLFEFLGKEAGDNVRNVAQYVLCMLCNSPISLKEQECYDLALQYVKFTAIEWSAVRNILEQFNVIRGDYWKVVNEELEKFVSKLVEPSLRLHVCNVLGDYYFSSLMGYGIQDKNVDFEYRKLSEYAVAILYLYREANEPQKLLGCLKNRIVNLYLVKTERHVIRSAWLYLFLDTDININDEIYSFFKDEFVVYGANDTIVRCIADLFLDFEVDDHFEEMKKSMGDVNVNGSFLDSWASYSMDFLKIMRELLRLKEESNVRTFYNRICEVIDNQPDFKDCEKCRLLYYKSDCEYKLHDYGELMKTANLYFETAVKSGKISEFKYAMLMRANALDRTNRTDEAIKLFYRLLNIHEEQGEFRTYMCCLNYLGTSLYRVDQFEKSISLLEKTYNLWRKKGNIKEANNVYVNLCNAYYMWGDVKKALEKTEELYFSIREFSQNENLSAQLLGNMGYYAYSLEKYSLSEKYLTEALELAEKMSLESTFINAANNLRKLYQKTGKFIKGFEIGERMMEMFWKRREYSKLIETLGDCCNLLSMCNHTRQIRVTNEKWKKRFSTIEGGEKYFNEKIQSIVYDQREIERLTENLAMAKSDGDSSEIAESYISLAFALFKSDRESYVKYTTKAAEILSECELGEKLEKLVARMLVNCYTDGKPYSEEELGRILSYSSDPQIESISRLWITLGAYGIKKSEKSFEELLADALEYAERYSEIMVNCFYDVAEKIAEYASSESIIGMVESFEDEYRDILSHRFRELYTANVHKDVDEMKKDYISIVSETKLSFYERGIEFLKRYDAPNAAAISGNIALIFRRRKDKEKTLYYHRLSAEIFIELGNIYDALIEKLNLATAQKEFSCYDDAIKILREGVREAKENDLASIEAALAGNLASLLRDNGSENDHEEIVFCFEIEEKFYRSQNLSRDLVISLVNQVAYYAKRTDSEIAISKLKEAGELIRLHRFKEYYQILSYFENAFGVGKDEASLETPEEFAKDILSVLDGYTLENIFKNNNGYNADFKRKALENDKYVDMVRIVFDPDKGNEVYFIVAFLPFEYLPSAKEKVEEYIRWSNEQVFYKMKLLDKFQVQGSYNIVAANREDLKKRIEFHMNLWKIDCMNLTLISTGFEDLSMCMGLKLRVINEDEE